MSEFDNGKKINPLEHGCNRDQCLLSRRCMGAFFLNNELDEYRKAVANGTVSELPYDNPYEELLLDIRDCGKCVHPSYIKLHEEAQEILQKLKGGQ